MYRNDYRNSSYNHEKGKFLKFFDDNEYDSEDIEDELGDDAEAHNCSYIEFDDNFPVHSSIKNPDDKQREIFRILRNCYKYGKASQINPKFELTDNFMKSLVDLHILCTRHKSHNIHQYIISSSYIYIQLLYQNSMCLPSFSVLWN